MHLHIGSNTPGFLPENDTYCVGSAEDAAACVRSEVMTLGEFVADGCDEGNCRRCSWCRKGRAILADWQNLGNNADALVTTLAGLTAGSSWNKGYDVPCSPGQIVWVQVVDSDRDACEDNADSPR